jgi:hypothetical protein
LRQCAGQYIFQTGEQAFGTREEAIQLIHKISSSSR